MLHLGSKFLHCKIVDASINAKNYKEINDVYSSAFILMSPG